MHSPSVIPKVRALALLGFLLALCLAALPSPARAEPDPRARPTNPVALEHFQSGNRLFRVREFDKAIAEYKAGALREDAPVFQYNLAQAYRMAGRHEEALWHYENFLGRLPAGDPNRAKVEELMAQVKAENERHAPAPPVPTVSSNAPIALSSSSSVHAPVTQKASGNRSSLPWILTGSAALLAGGSAIAINIWAKDTYDDAKRAEVQTERNSLEGSANSRRHLAQGLAIGTAGLVGVATYLFIRSHRPDRTEPPQVTFAPYSTHQSTGLLVSGGW